MCTLPVASAWILSRRWLSGPRGRYASGCRGGGRPGWALVVTGHAVGGNAARLKRAQKGGAGGDPEETALGGGRRGRFLGRPGPLRTSCRSSSESSTGPSPPDLLLMRLVGHEPQAPRPVRGAPRREGHRQADGRDPAPGLSICSRTAGRPAPSTRSAWSTRPRQDACGFPGGRGQGCPWTGRRRAGRSSGHRA